jgi:hypothetical protein
MRIVMKGITMSLRRQGIPASEKGYHRTSAMLLTIFVTIAAAVILLAILALVSVRVLRKVVRSIWPHS